MTRTVDSSHRGAAAGLTRRWFMRVSIGTSAALVAARAGSVAATDRDLAANRVRSMKVDVHHHMIPPVWAAALRSTAASGNLREWSPQASLDFMDAHGIQAAMLSLTTPGSPLWEGSERREMFRKVNEYGADLAKKTPNRFGHFVALPLPDMDGALKELEYSFDHLTADGVILMSNIGDQYLGDSYFAPLWAELERRKAVVFIHPNSLTLPAISGVPPALVDYPFATTRAAVDMVVHGMFTPQSKMKVILSHGGGYLPYISQRLAKAGSTLPGAPNQDTLLETYRHFYFDTALSSSPPALAALMKFADPSRVLFGSDFPYGAGMAGEFTDTLDRTDQLSDPEYTAIAHGNAARLFPGRFSL